MPKSLKNYKDKEKAHLYRNRSRKTYYKKTQTGKRRCWTTEEMEMILDKKYSDMELADILERSVQSIQIKRSRLKLERGGK